MSIPGSIRRAESFKTPRNIAAPFQSSVDANGLSGQHSPLGKNKDHNELRFDFPVLDDLSEVTYEKVRIIKFDNNFFVYVKLLVNIKQYCGPTPESNWVIPNHLLVGAYPASQDDAETFELITSILKLGITKFVCLQQEVSTFC